MTVSQIEPVKNHYGNNSAITFDFDFYIETENQLLVQHTDMNGLQTTLTLGVDYSINEIGNEEGSYITFPLQGSEYGVLAWNQSTDEKELLTISLNIPFSQDFEFDISGELDKSQLERAFDYGMRIDQILKRRIERAVLVPEGSDIDTDKLTQDIMIVSDNVNSINTNASNISDINTVVDNVTDINTVAGSITNVNTVAENINAVVAVDDNKTNINAVNSNKTNINTVAGSINNVNTVAGSISNINTTATNITNIN